jgi:hypothetical protein
MTPRPLPAPSASQARLQVLQVSLRAWTVQLGPHRTPREPAAATHAWLGATGTWLPPQGVFYALEGRSPMHPTARGAPTARRATRLCCRIQGPPAARRVCLGTILHMSEPLSATSVPGGSFPACRGSLPASPASLASLPAPWGAQLAQRAGQGSLQRIMEPLSVFHAHLAPGLLFKAGAPSALSAKVGRFRCWGAHQHARPAPQSAPWVQGEEMLFQCEKHHTYSREST